MRRLRRMLARCDGHTGGGHVRIPQCLDLLEAALLREGIEAGEDLLEQQGQLLGLQGGCHVGETDDVGDHHGDVHIAVRRDVRARLQPRGDGIGRHVEREPLRPLSLGHHLIEQLLQLFVLAVDLDVQQANLEHVVDARQHLGDIERFADEVFRTGFERAELVIRLGRDHQDRKVSIFLDVLQSFHHLEAVHAGHLEIEHNQVVAILLVQRMHRVRIEGRRDRLIPGAGQHALEQQDIGRQIVDDQDLGLEDIGGLKHVLAPTPARRPAPP